MTEIISTNIWEHIFTFKDYNQYVLRTWESLFACAFSPVRRVVRVVGLERQLI